MEPLPFQSIATDWCINNESSCAILAFEMGLGKTIISCNILKTRPLYTLILAPPALLHQWQHQLKTSYNLESIIYHGPNRNHSFKHIKSFNIVLSTAATISNDVAKDASSDHLQFKRMIIDEAHQLRNPKSKIYKQIHILSQSVPNKIFLTGTPICNSHNDLISLICLSNLEPYNKTSYWSKININKRIETLNSISHKILLRNTKEETISHILPPCNQLNININLEPSEQYTIYQSQQYDNEILRKLLRMRQALNNHTHLSPSNDTPIKILAINNIIKNIPSSDKIIIFSYFTSFLIDLQTILPNSLIYHGKLNTNSRQETLSSFKTDPNKKILLINLRAGGCGLNLTEANHLILVEPYWNTSEEEQAINRIHRYGQAKTCYIYKLQINNTIESWMKAIQLSKKTTSDLLVDNINITTEDLILQKENQDLLFKKIISFN